MSDPIPIGNPKAWSDDQWLQAMAVKEFPPKVSEEAVALIAAWNAARAGWRTGQAFAVGSVAAPMSDDEHACVSFLRRLKREGGEFADVVMVAVSPGMGQTVATAVARSLGGPR